MRWKKFISIWFYSRHSLILLSLSPSAFFDSARWSRKIFLFFFPFCVYYFCARLIEVLIWHGRPHSNGPIFNGKGGKNPARLPFISLSLQNWQTMGRHFPPGESKVSTSGHGREEMKWCSAKRPTKGLESRWMKKRPPAEKIFLKSKIII